MMVLLVTQLVVVPVMTYSVLPGQRCPPPACDGKCSHLLRMTTFILLNIVLLLANMLYIICLVLLQYYVPSNNVTTILREYLRNTKLFSCFYIEL
jgi:hypothetical protein